MCSPTADVYVEEEEMKSQRSLPKLHAQDQALSSRRSPLIEMGALS